jgi:hypothetical protein
VSVTKTLLPTGVLGIALCLTGCPSNPATGPTAAGTPSQTPRTFSVRAGCDIGVLPKPRWFPRDLPLPKGSVNSLKLAGTGGFHRALLFVPVGIRTFHRFLSARWPAAGYVLGRIAVGHNEFSGSFVKGPARGTFDVHVDCPHVLQLYLSYAAGSPSPSSS